MDHQQESPTRLKASDDQAAPASLSAFAARMAVASIVVMGILILSLGIWYLLQVFMLVFAALLLAILLRTFATAVSSVVPIPTKGAFVAVVIAIVLLIGATGWLLLPRIAEQFDGLAKQVPAAIDQIQSQVRSTTWGEKLLNEVELRKTFSTEALRLFRAQPAIFSKAAGLIVSVLVVAIVGLYIGFDPERHKEGLLYWLPDRAQAKARECIDAGITTIRWWLMGKALSMIVVGVMTAIGLWLLGVPLAASLALIAGALAFIPNFGPILSLIPAVLVASMESLSLAGYVVVLYIAIQMVENYLITPLIQEQNVDLPPVAIIIGQIVMGILSGLIGVMLATPILALLKVVLEKLYVRDLLGKAGEEE